MHEWASVVNSHHYALATSADPDVRAEGQSAMGGSERLAVQSLAVSRSTSAEAITSAVDARRRGLPTLGVADGQAED
jgi:hypothetical protein